MYSLVASSRPRALVLPTHAAHAPASALPPTAAEVTPRPHLPGTSSMCGRSARSHHTSDRMSSAVAACSALDSTGTRARA
eukprot:3220739-Prymnesium_polylepis.1